MVQPSPLAFQPVEQRVDGSAGEDTALGPVTLRRAWYRCADCTHGFAPRDTELGVVGTSLSAGLAAMNDIAAATGPFAKAAGLLEDLAGVQLTVKRVERAAEGPRIFRTGDPIGFSPERTGSSAGETEALHSGVQGAGRQESGRLLAAANDR
jgi:hypothetical protein